MKKLLFVLLSVPIFAQYFSNPVNLRATVDNTDVMLTWEIEQISQVTPPYNSYQYEIERSKDGTFSDLNFNSDTATMTVYTGSNYYIRQDTEVEGLSSGGWYFRLRVLLKPDDPVTEWSNIAFVDVPVGLGVPSLTFIPAEETVTADLLTVSVTNYNLDVTPTYDLFYDTDLNNLLEYNEVTGQFLYQPEYSILHMAPNNQSVQLFGVFDHGQTIYFRVRSHYNGKYAFSIIYRKIYDPNVKYAYFVAHTANTSDVETSIYIDYTGSVPSLVEFMALGKSGAFGSPSSPQIVRSWLNPYHKMSVNTIDIFPDIHRKPIMISSEQPLNLVVIYRTNYGLSENIASVMASEKAVRDIELSGMYSSPEQVIGAAVSNTTDYEGGFYFYFEYVYAGNFNSNVFKTNTASLIVKPYETTVFLLKDYLSLPVDRIVGTLYISSNVPIVAVGSVNNWHQTFSTVDFFTE